MERIIKGHFHGTGADLYLQLGGIPAYFKMWNLELSTPAYLEWSPVMGADDLTVEGILRDEDGGALSDLAFGEGVSPYYGGDLLTTTNQPSTTYGGSSVDFIEIDDKDYRFYTDNDAGISGDASSEDIDTWTLDTAGTPSGHFNGDVVGTYINDGSPIRIMSSDNKHVYDAYIVASALSGSGGAADEVTLSWAVPSGSVQYIGGRYGCKPTPVGKVSKEGLLINDTTVNASGNMVGFIAWMI